MLTAIVSFNVFVAVLTSQVHEKLMEDQKMNKKQITQLEDEVLETGEEVQAGFKEVLNELKKLRVDVKTLQDRLEDKKE